MQCQYQHHEETWAESADTLNGEAAGLRSGSGSELIMCHPGKKPPLHPKPRGLHLQIMPVRVDTASHTVGPHSNHESQESTVEWMFVSPSPPRSSAEILTPRGGASGWHFGHGGEVLVNGLMP